MRGYIKKRYKGSYSIVLSMGRDPATGKYKYKWFTVRGSKKDAEKRLAEILHKMDTGMFIEPGKTSVAEYLERWLNDYCRNNLAPRTIEGYEYIVYRHLIPSIGKITLTNLKPEHLQHLYSDKQSAGLSRRTIRYIHVTIHKALRDAVRLRILARNPADAVVPVKVLHHEMKAMSESDIHIFLEFAKMTPYYALFYTALFTGMRRSELLALRWSDVDLVIGQVSVVRALHQLNDGSLTFREPKTVKGRRQIALTPSNVLILKEHRQNQTSQRILLGINLKKGEELVFSQIDGTPLLPNTVSHAWKKLAARSGLKGIRLHDARHTHASLMLKKGIHPKIVQERLGHATIQITLDTYSHVTPGLQQAAARHFDEMVLPDENIGSPEIIS